MKVTIRAYQNSDFEDICRWWEVHDECPPLHGMMVEDGTFIAEVDGKKIMTLTALTTQSKEISFFKGFCASPDLDKKTSNEIANILWEHCIQYLKSKGCRRVIATAIHKKIMFRYQDLGMRVDMNGLYSLSRVI